MNTKSRPTRPVSFATHPSRSSTLGRGAFALLLLALLAEPALATTSSGRPAGELAKAPFAKPVSSAPPPAPFSVTGGRKGSDPIELAADARKALAACASHPSTSCAPQARLSLASALARLRNEEEARLQLKTALFEAVKANDPRLSARIGWHLAALVPPSEPAAGLKILDEALGRLGAEPPDDLIADLEPARAERFLVLGRNLEAREAAKRGGGAAERLHDSRRLVGALREEGLAELALGHVEDGIAGLDRALFVAGKAVRQLGALPLPPEARASGRQLASLEATVATDLAEIDLDRDRYARAERRAREAIAFAAEAESSVLGSAARFVLVSALYARKEYDAGAGVADEAVGMLRRSGESERELELVIELGLLELDHQLLGAAVERLRSLTELAAKLTAVPPPDVDISWRILSAGVAEAVGDPASAERSVEKALEIASSRGDADSEARLLARLATLRRRVAGREAEAVAGHRKALERIAAGRFRGDAWWLWSELAGSLDAAKAPDAEIADALEKSLDLFAASVDEPRSRTLRRLHPPDVHAALARVFTFRLSRKDVEGAFEAADFGAARRGLAIASSFGGRAEPLASPKGLVARLRAALGKGRVLILPVVGSPKSFLFVVRDSGIVFLSLPEREEFAKLAAGAARELAGASGDGPAAQQLSKLFSGAVASRSGEWPDELLLVADGSLDAVPVELLPIGGGKGSARPLGELSAVGWIPSASAWLALRSRVSEPMGKGRGGVLAPFTEGVDRAPEEVRQALRSAGKVGRRPLVIEAKNVAERGIAALVPEGLDWLEIALAGRYASDELTFEGEGRPLSLARLLRGGPRLRLLLAGARVPGGGDAGGATAELALAEGFLAAGSEAVVLPAGGDGGASGGKLLGELRKRVARGETMGEALAGARHELLAEKGDRQAPLRFRLYGDPGARARKPGSLLPIWAGGGVLLILVIALRARRRRRRSGRESVFD